MATIKSGASTDQLTVDTTSKAARVTLYDSAGNELFGKNTGRFITTGGTSAVVAASLAASTMLMSMRKDASATSVYITKLRLQASPATVGTSALVAGSIGWQRFTAQTPTGGTARTAAKKSSSYGSSVVTDIRDSNAALTGSAPTFGDVLAQTQIPIMTVGAAPFVWEIATENDPIVLIASDGLALRTQVIMPATQTWMYSYQVEWYER